MASQAPAFENADKCRGCDTGFSLFNRKHHCRNCGRTMCGNCSSGSISLPHFGIHESVRVCDKCLGDVKAGRFSTSASASASSPPPAAAAARRSTPSAAAPAPAAEPAPVAAPPPKVRNCTCNSPLCICPPDPVEKEEAPKPAPVAPAPAKPKPAPAAAPAPAAPSTFMGFGGSSRPTTQWNLKGDLNEQLRDAIKEQDLAGVRLLLDNGADARYVDRTGNSLAHLASLFNRLDILQMLHDKGADFWKTNPSKETPIDLAPPALQRKMKEMQPKQE